MTTVGTTLLPWGTFVLQRTTNESNRQDPPQWTSEGPSFALYPNWTKDHVSPNKDKQEVKGDRREETYGLRGGEKGRGTR